MRRMSPLERLDVVNEIRLLASIMHVNICRYYEAFMDGNFLCIVMEFAVNGAAYWAALHPQPPRLEVLLNFGRYHTIHEQSLLSAHSKHPAGGPHRFTF